MRRREEKEVPPKLTSRQSSKIAAEERHVQLMSAYQIAKAPPMQRRVELTSDKDQDHLGIAKVPTKAREQVQDSLRRSLGRCLYDAEQDGDAI